MPLIAGQVGVDIRLFHHIDAENGGQGRQAKKLIGLVKQEMPGNALVTFKKSSASSNACCGAFQVAAVIYSLPRRQPGLPSFALCHSGCGNHWDAAGRDLR